MKKLNFLIVMTVFWIVMNAICYYLGLRHREAFGLGCVNGVLVILLTALLVDLLKRRKRAKMDSLR